MVDMKDLNFCNRALIELGIEPIKNFDSDIGKILLNAPDFVNHYRLALYLMPYLGIFNDRLRKHLQDRLGDLI